MNPYHLLSSPLWPALAALAVVPPLYAAPAFPLNISENRRFLVDQRDQPFFVMGDTPWFIQKLKIEDVRMLMDDRLGKGFNTLFLELLDDSRIPSRDGYDQLAFNPDEDITQPVEAYWSYAEQVMDEAQKRGLFVIMSELWYGAGDGLWMHHVKPDNAKTYGAFIGRRFARFKNLMWMHAGDRNPDANLAECTRVLAREIKAAAPHHLHTVHNAPGFASARFHHADPWLDVNMGYTYGAAYLHILPEYQRSNPVRPVILGETGYEAEPNAIELLPDAKRGDLWNPDRIRRNAWWAVLSGASGYCAGSRLWRWESNWRETMQVRSIVEAPNILKLLSRLEWWKLAPDTAHQFVTKGFGTWKQADYATAALAEDGGCGLVYLPSGRTFTVDLSKLAAGMTARWFDPSSGAWRPASDSSLKDRVRRDFTPPGTNAAGESDWVLVFQQADRAQKNALPAVTASDEEFVGPFPSWRDAQRDYGARGNGEADDTAALQRALDDLVQHTNSCVLYLPAGTYRLTGTLQTVRKAHTDCQGVAIIGEAPARTILRWDGTNGGTMFQWDAWYSKISRLTFDGAGRAGTALFYGPAFSTYNETSDLIFRDATNGLVFGGPQTQGQAENAVLRCQFVRCGIGLQTVNWNSMDIWVWHGRFEDCGRGVHNVMGNWHVWESLFLRSRLADLSSINLMAFSVVNNTSIGSRCFLDFSTGHTWGSPVSLTGNCVLDPTGDWAVLLDNAGPYLVADNQFRLTGAARGIRMTWADQTLVGNIYSKTNAVEERGRFRRFAENVVPANAISGQFPSLPPTPQRRQRAIIEVPANADADTIQQALNEAAQPSGQRPVVHLPMGNYKIAKSLVIPAGCDLQLIGDSAGETGSRLNWTGPNDGVVLRVEGPSHATLRDFFIHAGGARALLVENCDQPRGRIFADQLNANGPSVKGSTNAAAFRLSGLDHTDVLLRALQGSGHAGRWVEVLGGPEAGRATNQVSIFTGATGSAAGQYDVRQGGRLVVRGVYHERSSDSLNGLHLADRGTLSIDATRFSYATSPDAPTVAADNFRGVFTLATCMLLPVETKASCRFELRGDGSDASVLALNNQFWIEQKTTADDVWRNLAQPPARGGLVGCNVNTGKKEAAPRGFEFLANIGDHPDPAKSALGAGPLDNRGTVDDATLLRHLAPLRTARVWLPDASVSDTATDLRIYRVMAGGGRGAVVEFSARR